MPRRKERRKVVHRCTESSMFRMTRLCQYQGLTCQWQRSNGDERRTSAKVIRNCPSPIQSPFARARSTQKPSMAASKLRTIAAAWPTDPFRPNMQLKKLLESLSEHPRLTPDAVQSARALLENGVQRRVSISSLCAVLVVLEPCLQYPLSKKTLEPASMPKHYERLVQGYERSAQGIRRPWWQVFFGIWR